MVKNDEETVILVSTGGTSNYLDLQGVNGFNNGVKLLHDLCSQLYGNSRLKASARSLTLEIMAECASFDLPTRFSPNAFDARVAPAIYVTEYDSKFLDGSTGYQGRSEQREWCMGMATSGTMVYRALINNGYIGQAVNKGDSTVLSILFGNSSWNPANPWERGDWLATRIADITSVSDYGDIGAQYRAIRSDFRAVLGRTSNSPMPRLCTDISDRW